MYLAKKPAVKGRKRNISEDSGSTASGPSSSTSKKSRGTSSIISSSSLEFWVYKALDIRPTYFENAFQDNYSTC